MKNISGRIAEILWIQGTIQKDDIEVCKYGVETLISSVTELLFIFVLAGFCGNFVHTFLFFAAFIPLRIYAGGYHAATKLRCFFLSVAVYGVFAIMLRAIPGTAYGVINIFLSSFSLLLVLFASPVIHKNKTVTDGEKKYYRKFSIWICSFEIFVILLLTVFFPQSSYIFSLACGQAAVAFSMLAVLIKEKKTDNKSISIRKEGK